MRNRTVGSAWKEAKSMAALLWLVVSFLLLGPALFLGLVVDYGTFLARKKSVARALLVVGLMACASTVLSSCALGWMLVDPPGPDVEQNDTTRVFRYEDLE